MAGNECTHPDASTNTGMTVAELKAALSQYLRMLKQAGIDTFPKGRGHFNFEYGLSEVDSCEIGSNEIDAVERQLASTDSAIIAKESSLAYVAKTAPTSLNENRSASPSQLPAASQIKGLAEHDISVEFGRKFVMDSAGHSSANKTSYPASLSKNRRLEDLQVLEAKVGACTKCSELSSCRNRVVFGVGNVTPRLVFLGEAPGAEEDRQGEPFVGAAGQLLNKIIEACKLARADVYILNTIKCRPPGNRNPAPDELDNCWDFTQRQLEILRPDFICCLGLIATKQLLKTTQPLGQLRQKFHHYRDSRVVVTYHPAYLLRMESAKKHVWEDMKMLMSEMGSKPGA